MSEVVQADDWSTGRHGKQLRSWGRLCGDTTAVRLDGSGLLRQCVWCSLYMLAFV